MSLSAKVHKKLFLVLIAKNCHFCVFVASFKGISEIVFLFTLKTILPAGLLLVMSQANTNEQLDWLAIAMVTLRCLDFYLSILKN